MPKIEIEVKDDRIVAPEKTVVGNGWWVHWTCVPDMDFSIRFEDESPFKNEKLILEKSAAAEPTQITTRKRSEITSFKYSIHAGGKVLDPEIIVDPDQTPGRG